MAGKWKYERRIVTGYDPLTGNQLRSRVYGNSKAEFQRNLQKAHAKAYKLHAVDNITFGDFADVWLSDRKEVLAYNTLRTYKSDLNAFEPLFSKSLTKITSSDLQKIFNKNWEHARRCERMYLTVNQIFEYAIDEKLLFDNPCTHITLPKRKQKEKRALSDEEVRAVKNASLKAMDRLFLDTEYYFGLRPEECRALCGRDFDFNNNLLHVTKASVFIHQEAIIKETKNQRIRSIPIPEDFSQKHRDELLANPGYLFTLDGSDKLLTETRYRWMYGRIFDAINRALGGNEDDNRLNKMTMYTLRHNFCTHLYYSSVGENKITIKMAAYLAGNSVHVFLNSYAHLDLQREKKSASDILNTL